MDDVRESLAHNRASMHHFPLFHPRILDKPNVVATPTKPVDVVVAHLFVFLGGFVQSDQPIRDGF